MTSETVLRARWFLGIVAAQLALVVLLAAFHQSALLAGTRIRLKVVPVDPRSLFMGQYLDLRYEAETMDLNQIALKGLGRSNTWGGPVAVILREEGGIARTVAVRNPPCPAKMPPRQFCLSAPATQIVGETMRVEFDFDRYYVPEAKAAEAERLFRDAWARGGVVLAEIAVTRWGRGYIVRILIDGKPLPF